MSIDAIVFRGKSACTTLGAAIGLNGVALDSNSLTDNR